MLDLKNFIKDVEKEVRQLKKYATKDELNNLNLETFNFIDKHGCIYGQMTGDCTSERSKELMDKACVKVVDLDDGVTDINGISISNNRFECIEDYIGQTWDVDPGDVRSFAYLSLLEGYICTTEAKIKNIIDYLKGESKTLNLTLN